MSVALPASSNTLKPTWVVLRWDAHPPNPLKICLIEKQICLAISTHATASWAEGSRQQEVKAVHFLRLLPLVLRLHTQGCPGSGAIRNDLCQRAHYRNHLSLLVHVWIWRTMLGSNLKAWCTVQLGWEANHYVNLLGSHALGSILTACVSSLTVGWMGSHNENTLYLNDYLFSRKTKSTGFCDTEKRGMAP